jgi:hypothetical protein
MVQVLIRKEARIPLLVKGRSGRGRESEDDFDNLPFAGCQSQYTYKGTSSQPAKERKPRPQVPVAQCRNSHNVEDRTPWR